MPSVILDATSIIRQPEGDGFYSTVTGRDIYDQGQTMWATRLWWNLRYVGHDDIYVLDGGLPAWQETGYEIETGTGTPREPQQFVAHPRPELYASVDEVTAAIDDPNRVLVNSLDRPTFTGERHTYARPGRIPGSKHIFFGDLLESAGRSTAMRWPLVGSRRDNLRMRVSTHVDGPAPVELAWERYADPGRWSTWAAQIRSVEIDRDMPTRIHSGLTGTVHAMFGVHVRFRVTDVDTATRSWSWTVHPPALKLHLVHTVEHRPTGSRAGLVIHGPAPIILAYLPLARRALQRLVAL